MTALIPDPRTVPVTQVDSHLPAVLPAALRPNALRARFAAPPVWQAEFLREKMFMARAPMPAAVLLPIVQRPEPTVLLTLRTLHLSTHSGQVAFPGGKVEESDADAVAAALREAHEEIGLAPQFVEVLGQLPVYVTGSAFHVTPVVALIAPEMVLRPNPFEVADVFEVPLAYLMNPAHHRHHLATWQGVQREWLSMPYQDAIAERFIWGATAGMLRNFYRFLRA
ncbi:MAG: CoA pyrophosphatase [Comamonadaceae bacterium CG_4_9_14_3_um_filter_60_33]|nr:MAG: coenzyme A pyrophosphatase [Comamonadaceae bacterium CG2_30_59_20]PIY28979.1 MAG: CoA pyrophosphatase [Comamonadaceae bacterium CG_4_10_14_3_um_filter_60_42]PJB46065.1 MAG: CoA pyrophosphatase [Comamonadaceae bacterium CG_4_9_14_3_um_filter_60_33]